jgi:fructose-1,6-bisphosphatase/inositol monophosphatase family enzyme
MKLFQRADADALAELLREAARREIMPRFRRLGAGEVRAKSNALDLVTAADEAAERIITAGLREMFAGCVVVGEEATAADPALLGALAGADLAFVVDPIDGTANFAAGMPLFGCMAAAVIRHEVVACVILDPVCGVTAMALRGEGAWSTEADGRQCDLHVAAPVPVAQMVGVASWHFLPAEMKATVCRNLPRVAASWDFRCAAHEYRAIAAGHCDYLLFNRLLPWDHAPGWLLHREAGGFSALFDGTHYRPMVTSGGLICTPDETSWLALRAALMEI